MPATRVVLFDLDGTFADTAPDLGYALNVQLQAHGKAPLPIDRIRRVASSGARGLLGLGFALAPGDPGYEPMAHALLDVYERNLCNDTTLFPGIAELIEAIETRGMRWGIVTNKAERFALPLMRLLELDARASCTICGDTTPHRKPHPEPLLAAARSLDVTPSACIYVGDDERDMIAGRAAGMRVAVARYGYLGTGTPPDQWPADYRIDNPLDLLAAL